MEALKVAEAIKVKIKLLEVGREQLQSCAQAKADSIGDYEKELAKVIIQLKNGVEMELDGHKVKNPLTTIVEKIARGLCWEKKIKMELAEGLYKNAHAKMESVEAELNGWQSVNRYLEIT